MIGLLSFIAAQVGSACDLPNSSHFFGFPYWYSYLPGVWAANDPGTPSAGLSCTPDLGDFTHIWLIVAAVIEILLRVAALIAVGFVIYGGFNYMTSQGEPDATGRAKSTLSNALIGLAIAVMAAAIVAFIAGNING